MTDRTCPICLAKSGHHRRDCPARGKRSGPVPKAPELKAVTLQVSFPPEMAAWLRKRLSDDGIGISQTVQQGVRLVRGY